RIVRRASATSSTRSTLIGRSSFGKRLPRTRRSPHLPIAPTPVRRRRYRIRIKQRCGVWTRAVTHNARGDKNKELTLPRLKRFALKEATHNWEVAEERQLLNLPGLLALQ